MAGGGRGVRGGGPGVGVVREAKGHVAEGGQAEEDTMVTVAESMLPATSFVDVAAQVVLIGRPGAHVFRQAAQRFAAAWGCSAVGDGAVDGSAATAAGPRRRMRTWVAHGAFVCCRAGCEGGSLLRRPSPRTTTFIVGGCVVDGSTFLARDIHPRPK